MSHRVKLQSRRVRSAGRRRAPGLETLERRELLATFTVSNTGDAGAGSLRQAILDANASAGADRIAFNLGGSGPFVISPASPLPDLAGGLFLDGGTQPGNGGAPGVAIRGDDAGDGSGLRVTGPDVTIQGLAIHGFLRWGIELASADAAVVRANVIGADPGGATALPNRAGGVLLGAVSRTTIGGPAAGDGNLISGNLGDGVRVAGGPLTQVAVIGNTIGTNAAGSAPLGNGGHGIANAGGDNLVIRDNLVSGNAGAGMSLEAANQVVQGNKVGTDRSGLLPIANGGSGVRLGPGSVGNLVGGLIYYQANTIAFNAASGIAVAGGATSHGNRFQFNSIFENAGIGIDLNEDGVTPNGSVAPDAGANRGQNFPVLRTATSGRGQTLTGSFAGTPSTTFVLEFYWSDAADPSGHGEGKVFFGRDWITTDAAGRVDFESYFNTFLPSQKAVTATATDPAGNMSEFSPAVISDIPPPSTLSIEQGVEAGEASGSVRVFVQRSGRNSEPATVAYTTVDGTAVAGRDYTATSGTLTFSEGSEGTLGLRIPILDNPRVDGTRTFSIRLTILEGGVASGPLTSEITIRDDDRAALDAERLGGRETYEAGGDPARFAFRLTSQPAAPVSFDVRSSDPGEGVPDVSSLRFTPDDWSTPRYISVRGVDDGLIEGPIDYALVVSPSVSPDPLFNGLTGASFALTNISDDVAGFVVGNGEDLFTTEDGGTARFTIRLRAQPSAPVLVRIANYNGTEIAIDQSELAFDPSNWNIPQTVTVRGVADDEVDPDRFGTVSFGPIISDDPRYSNGAVANFAVTVVNRNIDVAGWIVEPTSGLATTDTGGTASFSVRLTSRPQAPVTIPVASSRPELGTADRAALVFDPSNWNVPQAVTVRGAIDRTATGDLGYTIDLGWFVSSDPLYHAQRTAVPITQRDSDAPAFLLNADAGLIVSEAGGAAAFTARLGSRPTAPVYYRLAPTEAGLVRLSAAELVFTRDNWDIPQAVVVTGLPDRIALPDRLFVVTATPVSFDPAYAGLAPGSVAGVHRNVDVAGVVATPGPNRATGEDGGSTTVAIRLASRTLGAVRVPVASTNPGEGRVLTPDLVFTPDNWDVDQVVTIVGVDDVGADGPVTYAIVVGPVIAGPAPDGYAGLVGPTVDLINLDNDAAGVLVVPTTPATTSNAGGAAGFAVSLRSRPSGPVAVTFTSADPGRGTVANPVLIFTPDNWNIPQAVTVVGSRDDPGAGAVAYSIAVAAQSPDPGYNALPLAPLALTQVRVAPPAPALPAPTPLVTAQVATVVVRRRKTQALVLGFGNALNAASAANPDNYQIVAAGRDGKFGTRDDVRTRVKAAAYDPATRTVRLTPAPKANLGTARLQLRVRGDGLLDANNQAVDGNRDGRPGGDAVVTINRKRALFP